MNFQLRLWKVVYSTLSKTGLHLYFRLSNMEMNQQDAQILLTSLSFRMLDMFRTV